LALVTVNMKRIGIIVVPFICGVAIAAVPAEATPSRAEIVSLIDQLVSPNSQPKQDGPEVMYPQGFDKAAQARVHTAFHKLTAIGLPAFPYLQARLGDERYCFTMDAGPADANFSVGTVCRLIIGGHLQPYSSFTRGAKDKDGRAADPRTRPRRPSYFEHYKLDSAKAFQHWWKGHKDKSLREIQIEVLEWTIEREKQKPKDYSSEELRFLKAMLAKLRKSDKAMPPQFPFAK
jgi:hypothetical protein